MTAGPRATERDDSNLWRTLEPAVGRLKQRNASALRHQIDIARIAAPTGSERARAQYVAHVLAERGWHDQRMDSVGNVIAQWAPPHVNAMLAPVTCLAHLDTVFDADTPLDCIIDGDRISCPGISANGRGLTAMLSLARSLRHAEVESLLQRPIELVATVGEEGEGNLRGARHYFDRRAQHDLPPPYAVIVLDGPGDATIVHHAVGSHRLRIHLQGVGGHSWADYGTPNPIHALTAAAAAVARLGTRTCPRISVTVSRIQGGESLTSIPIDAWCDIDLRATNADALHAVATEIHRIAHTACRDESTRAPQSHPGRALRAGITLLGARPCGSLDASHPLVQIAHSATRWQQREPVSGSASTDANIAISRGIPAIAIGGGGRGGAAHSRDEWYDNTDGMRGVARALGILVAVAQQV